MNTLTCRLFFCLMAVLCTAAAAQSETALRVGTFEFSPLCRVQPGRGEKTLYLELLKQVAQIENWEIRYVPGTFEEGQQRLEEGLIDLLLATPYSATHTDIYDYTRETVISTWAEIYARPEKNIQSLLDLSGCSVGLMKNDPYGKELRDMVKRLNMECSFVEFDDYRAIFEAMSQGWVEAGAIDRLFSITFKPQLTAHKTSIIFSPIELRFAVPKGKNAAVISALDYFLERQKNDPGSVYHQQIGQILGSSENSEVLKKLHWALMIAGVVILMFAVVGFLLRLQVRRQTRALCEKNEKLQREIQERSRIEDQRMLLAAAMEQSVDSVIVTDAWGVILYANAAFRKEACESGRDPLGQHVLEYEECLWMNHDHFQKVWERVQEGESWCGRFSSRKCNGTVCEVEATFSPVKNAAGELKQVVCLRRDISLEVDLEKQLRHSQKMEAIGTLAGGIAHDFNNILTPILGYTEILLKNNQLPEKATRQLTEIFKASDRARRLVHQILTFCRKKEEERRPVQVPTIIKETLKLLRSTLPATIEIREDIANPSCCVLADPTQIHQVLMNLCTNAFHAMGHNGGKLTVALREVELKRGHLPQGIFLPAGRYLRLTVGDTGQGIAPQHIERIFDPYFTTKTQGEGTGLGLSLVHGIVKTLGGDLSVSSTPGEGTVFQIYWPTVDEDLLTFEPPVEIDLPGGNERILLVDDEPQVAYVQRDILQALGYRVTVCLSSLEAQQIFFADPTAYDLVLTDHTMPKMTGTQLTRRLLTVRPELPVIMCSGYSDAGSEQLAQSAGIRRYLMKPIVMQEMARAVREVLDAGKTAGIACKAAL